mmetsp:Transcript_101745/g.217870  ORF Transcript_101745/g.217870 Transcript_101745/m.217870 type:complete len:329 (+) Transcript_101745:104-1090(+)
MAPLAVDALGPKVPSGLGMPGTLSGAELHVAEAQAARATQDLEWSRQAERLRLSLKEPLKESVSEGERDGTCRRKEPPPEIVSPGRYQPFRPEWPRWRRQDHRPVDRTLVEVPSLDRLHRTKKGLARSSTGYIRYSACQAVKFFSDAEELVRILREVVPHNASVWSLPKLEQAFHDKVGRPGSWRCYGVPFKAFFALFPRTFQQFGPEDSFVRVWRKSRPGVVESGEDALKRLALAQKDGFIVEQEVKASDHLSMPQAPVQPELRKTSAKAWYRPSRSASSPSLLATPASRGLSRPASAVTLLAAPASRALSRPASAVTLLSAPAAAA